MPLTAALIGGGAALVGDFVQGNANRKAAHSAQDFAESQSDTVYQRGMADMRAAGLNPLLVAKMGGDPAAGGTSYSNPNIGSDVVNAYNSTKTSASAVSLQQKQQELIAAQTTAANASATAAKAAAAKSMQDAYSTQAEREFNYGVPPPDHMDADGYLVNGNYSDGKSGYKNLTSAFLGNQIAALAKDIQNKGLTNQILSSDLVAKQQIAQFFQDNPAMAPLSAFMDSIGGSVPFINLLRGFIKRPSH